ncbi:MAG TPA: DNA repair protein RecO [Candidatus Binatia bacterium]|nr:DNA repair protein RecO [Candidatus Binatia bacterium]
MSAPRKVQLQPAWLLSLRPYRETSALIEAFTRGHGRVGLVARGVRGAKSRSRGLLQPFRPLLLSWSEGGELGTLAQVESGGPAPGLAGESVFAGWYVNELLLRLMQRRDPHAAVFDAYGAVLQALPGDGAEAALRLFEKHLLADIGYGLQWPAEADGWFEYADDEGWRRVAEPAPGAYAGAHLHALRDGRLEDADVLREARRLLQGALARHLGRKPLRTPQMLRDLRAVARTRRSAGAA